MTTRRTTLKGLAAGALSIAGGGVLAQGDKSAITVLVGAASSMDFTARVIAEQLNASLGRTAIVVSKLGAGQRLALAAARNAPPDGNTLVFATSGPFTIYPHVYTKLDYDPVRDFTPIAGISSFDVAVATGPDTGITSIKQLVAYQKSKGAEAVFGSAPGNGSLSHFVGISISLATDTPMTHVPYKDSGVGIVDLATGRLPVMITGLSPMVEMHKAKKIRILAISGAKRSPLVPEVPTLREAGVDVTNSTSTAVFGPPGMDPAVVKRLHAALQPMFSNPETEARLATQGMALWPAKPQEVNALIDKESRFFAELVKRSGYIASAS